VHGITCRFDQRHPASDAAAAGARRKSARHAEHAGGGTVAEVQTLSHMPEAFYMTSRVATVALLALLAAAPAWAQNQPPPEPGATGEAMPHQLNQQDRDFLQKAAAGSIGEAEMGRLAEKQAAGPAVREFGRWMATDHGAINEALDRLSHRMGVTPTTAMDPEDQATLARLRVLRGHAFDAKYIPLQVENHEKTIALFQREEQEGQDPVLKSLARHTLDMLQEHLAEAQELAQLPEVAGRHSNAGVGSTEPRTPQNH
jgi:putative membrane protein